MKLTLIPVLLFMTAAGSFAANPYIGTWKFNDAKSKMRPEVTRNATVTYAEQGDYIKVTTDGTNSGKRIRTLWVGKFDGRAYPMKGSPFYNAAGMRLVNEHTVFIQGLKDGKVMWWGTITLSKDGKTRTALLHSTDAKGKRLTIKKVYDRA
jgi:uncharacterized protein (DUF2147 family)